MNNSEQIFKFVFKLSSKETAKMKINASLDCYFDENGILIHNEIKLLEGTMFDFFATKSWFSKKSHKTFEFRERIIKLLWWNERKQQSRPDKNSKLLHILTSNELKNLNSYLEKRYDGTINNIIGVLKGNNPAGSYENPNRSELKSDSIFFENNLVMLLDMLKIKKKNIDNKSSWKVTEMQNNDFLAFIKQSNIWPLISDFVNELEKYKKNNLNSSIEREKINNIKKQIWKYKEKYFRLTKEINNIVKNKRQKVYKLKEKINYFEVNALTKTEIAHIYPVKEIQKEIQELVLKEKIFDIRNLEKNKSYKELINQVIDYNNLLVLQPTIHTEYDAHKFYWDPESGSVVIVKESKMDKDIIDKIKEYNIDLNGNNNIRIYLEKYKKYFFKKL
ncbi:MAG4270 family putative restriction endonuclease [Mycoplasmopsis edwardii]|nr:HNH endonuclease [Mycoplasmopsis edwardii]